MSQTNVLVLIVMIAVTALFVVIEVVKRRQQDGANGGGEEPPIPWDGPCLELLGIDVYIPPELLSAAYWFDPTKWPMLSFPAGTPLYIAPIIRLGQGCTPPTRFDFIAYDVTHNRIAWRDTLTFGGPFPYVVWNGETFIAGCCGDTAPKPYRIVCIMHDAAGGIQQKEVIIHAVSEHACRAMASPQQADEGGCHGD